MAAPTAWGPKFSALAPSETVARLLRRHSSRVRSSRTRHKSNASDAQGDGRIGRRSRPPEGTSEIIPTRIAGVMRWKGKKNPVTLVAIVLNQKHYGPSFEFQSD